ncbi:MBL fold metallo-hydrolase [Candidatus Bipolaricaulota bacterium]|nr:MBL fold metallo-hydrolase [Candidatus Bipolaricaulota bacterium]
MANSGEEKLGLRITGIYDNYSSSDELVPGWGFSVLLELAGKKFLFDTGADVAILAQNMEELGVKPKELETVILSHPHCDHVGGLSTVLKRNSNLSVVLTDSFPDPLKKKIVNYGADLVTISDCQQISEGLLSTGEMDGRYRDIWVPEQSLFVNTRRGPVVIAGCAHPGIDNVVERAIMITGESPYLVLGGFHLGGASPEKVQDIIEKFKVNGIQKVAPSHCTGKRAEEAFKKEYGEDFIDFGAGKVVTV